MLRDRKLSKVEAKPINTAFHYERSRQTLHNRGRGLTTYIKVPSGSATIGCYVEVAMANDSFLGPNH